MNTAIPMRLVIPKPINVTWTDRGPTTDGRLVMKMIGVHATPVISTAQSKT